MVRLVPGGLRRLGQPRGHIAPVRRRWVWATERTAQDASSSHKPPTPGGPDVGTTPRTPSLTSVSPQADGSCEGQRHNVTSRMPLTGTSGSVGAWWVTTQVYPAPGWPPGRTYGTS